MTFHERTHVRHFVATFVRALTVFVVLPIVGRGFRARVSLFRAFTHRMLRISSTHETPWLASRTSKGLWNLALETRDQRGVRNSRAGKRVRRKRRRRTATASPTASPCRRPRSARDAPHGGRVLAHHPTANHRNSSRSPCYGGDTRAQPCGDTVDNADAMDPLDTRRLRQDAGSSRRKGGSSS